MSGPPPGTLRPAGADSAESSRTVVIQSAGLGEFASEGAADVPVPTWPARASAAPATARAADGGESDGDSGWTDEEFVIRFPDAAPLPETHLLSPSEAAADHIVAPVEAPLTRDRTRQALLVLGVIVALQSVPTFLWLQGRFTASPPPPAVEAVAAVPEPSVPTTGVAAIPEPPAEAPPPPVRAPRPATPPPAPAPVTIAAGLLSVDAPVPMQIVGRDGVVGTTEAATIMLPPGTHDLEFRSDAVGYRERRTVTLQSGRTTRVRLAPPPGRLHVNALPWAEVWIDGTPAGQTPIGNLETSVGTHEVRFRHPELGERRATVLVTLKEPARVSVDLRQP